MKRSAIALITAVLGLAPHAAADTLPILALSSTQPSSTSCVEPQPQANFSATGGNIYEYIVIDGMKTGDTVSARWINPYFQTVMLSTWPHSVSNPGNYCWTSAYLAASQYSYSPGTWYLQVDVNGQYLGQTAFTVTATWQSMTQQQRNQAIIIAGLNGHADSLATSEALWYSGLQCKPWVQWAVSLASNGSVLVPATEPDNYQWYPGVNVIQMSSSLQALQPGWILQLEESSSFISRDPKTATGPHTAIVLSISTAGIYLLDSNWVATNTVGIHFMKWMDFTSDFAFYTVYEIR